MQQLAEECLDERTVARMLNVAPATLQRWRWAERGPRFVKIGRLVRYKLSEISRFINEGERSSTSDNGRAA